MSVTAPPSEPRSCASCSSQPTSHAGVRASGSKTWSTSALCTRTSTAADLLLDPGDHRGDRAGVGDVPGDCEAGAAERVDVRGDLRGALGAAPVADGDGRPVRAEGPRDGRADAPAAARDERGAVGEEVAAAKAAGPARREVHDGVGAGAGEPAGSGATGAGHADRGATRSGS